MSDDQNGVHVSRTVLFKVADKTHETTKGLEKLALSGLTTDYYAAFAANIQLAKNFKTSDEVKKANAKKLSEVKKKCEECFNWVKKLQFYVKRAFKEGSPQWNELPEKISESKKDEAEMLNLLPATFTLADKYAVELKAKGMPTDYKLTGETLKGELETITKEHGKMVEQSQAYTVQRKLAHRKVYDTVNEINELGRQEYQDDPVTLKLFKSPWPQSKEKDNGTDTPPAPVQ
ncbi:MAG: hypothetical protein WC209_09285 [Ignavibacteriaceae bacterium]|jgi:hypothetical protein